MLCSCGSGLPAMHCCSAWQPYGPSPAAYAKARRRLRRSLHDFLLRFPGHRLEAERRYFGKPMEEVQGLEPDEVRDFLDHFACDYGPDRDGPRYVELFAEEVRDQASLGERVAVDDMLKSRPVLFELAGFDGSGGAGLRDALTGETLRVTEAGHLKGVLDGTLGFVRLDRWRGAWRTGDMVHLVSAACRARLLAEVRKDLADSGAQAGSWLRERSLDLPRMILAIELEHARKLALESPATVLRAQAPVNDLLGLLGRLVERSELDFEEVQGEAFQVEAWCYRIRAEASLASVEAPEDPELLRILGERTADGAPCLGRLTVRADYRNVVIETHSPEVLRTLEQWVEDVLELPLAWSPPEIARISDLAVRAWANADPATKSRTA